MQLYGYWIHTYRSDEKIDHSVFIEDFSMATLYYDSFLFKRDIKTLSQKGWPHRLYAIFGLIIQLHWTDSPLGRWSNSIVLWFMQAPIKFDGLNSANISMLRNWAIIHFEHYQRRNVWGTGKCTFWIFSIVSSKSKQKKLCYF